MKVAQQPQKPPEDPIRFELRPQVRKIHEQPLRSLYKTLHSTYVATAAAAAGSNIPICRLLLMYAGSIRFELQTQIRSYVAAAFFTITVLTQRT